MMMKQGNKGSPPAVTSIPLQITEEEIVCKIKRKRKRKRKPAKTEQPISSQTVPTPLVMSSGTEEEEEKLPEETDGALSTQYTDKETQQISNQADQTTDLLQEENNSEILQGDGGEDPIVCKIKRKRKRKRKPAQTEPVTAAASSEEQPQVEVDVDAPPTKNDEEETQPRSIFST
ncbi:unnamed protein product [Pleuronectes platessa]|uniref:Uncharacterized protein n=1 Tax=Pleuronectes platessa TaxID=8262 RepID=A0A9N7UI69_PLEPL|nr:unnamed protein product [Pleuronectes platessa]